MRILFNHPKHPNVHDMAEELTQQGVLSAYGDSCMEDSLSFVFEHIPFYIQYDRQSQTNPMIYAFVIESLNENALEGTEADRLATTHLYERLTALGIEGMLECDE